MMEIQNEVVPPVGDWPMEVMMVIRTMIALTGDGKDVDNYELANALVNDYGWRLDEAFDWLEYAESAGMIYLGPQHGQVRQ